MCNNYFGDNMLISKNIAHQIVFHLKDVINQDLNFMDKNGIIIASTDPNRVNSFHEAAKLCIDKKDVIIIESDFQYSGSKKGINMPVEFNDEIVGVIGITGVRDEIEKYGTIIKKMTEILLKEEWLKENELQRRNKNRHILEGIIYNKFDDFNITIDNKKNLAKYIAVARPLDIYPNLEESEDILKILDSYLFDHDNILYSFLFQELVILFINCSDIYIKRILTNINNSFKLIKRKKINYGISALFYDLNKTKIYYSQALSSLFWQEEYEKNPKHILFYDDVDLGILLSNISRENKNMFVNKVLGKLSNDDLKIYSNLIDTYGEKNGSIKAISEVYYMHKNTIQYRLNRLHELTGYNPREYNDYMILKLAFLLKNSEPQIVR